MAIPTFDQCIEPVLRHLARRPDGAPVAEIQAAVADDLGITKREREELLPSGAYPVYKSRIGWAHDRLKRSGYSTSVRRGYWKLTPEGVALAKRSKHLSAAEVARIAAEERPIAADSATKGITASESAGKSARERVDDAVHEITEVVTADLLAMVLDVPPEQFERIVLDVLHRMGYGARRQDLRHTGGAGDGGIDGEISLDRLGLERVCIQAKRWTQPLGPEVVRDFIGALDTRHAAKGVLMTTGRVTKDAERTAAKASKSIVLVDGTELARLMIEHEVGVTRRVVYLPEVDRDYFDDDAS